MTRTLVRGYAIALSLLGFSATYRVTAHNPYPQSAPDQAAVAASPAQVAALASRAARVNARAAAVRRTIDARRRAAVAPPPARVVTLPPVTRTQTS